MKYHTEKDKIVVQDTKDFCPMHILECGQVFRFKKIDNFYQVFSKDKCATIKPKYNDKNEVIGYDIITNDTQYFENYFDLKTDYNLVKNKVLMLCQNEQFMQNAVDFGNGIRLLNQDPFEATISFVISQNNNIKRIQLIIEKICEKFGTKIGEYYAFPTQKQLENATEQDFKNLGAGYRAKFLVNVIKYFDNFDFAKFSQKPILEMEKQLLSITGIGQKVADCIMLFGYHKMEYFPVDTWIEKVFREYFGGNVKLSQSQSSNRLKIREFLVGKFGEYSGYAQQYLFYFQRSEKNR